eukprot:TRINITY_DN2984_c1_g1_i1.p1 TRINITY_DN2984_c1_g1~~TRINITY_DN2984_c1_g1_i1.p1  ORF type:complete len:247 (-),score=55.20 TRINITY_DN2984_c1_g1_i1:26-766(-)
MAPVSGSLIQSFFVDNSTAAEVLDPFFSGRRFSKAAAFNQAEATVAEQREAAAAQKASGDAHGILSTTGREALPEREGEGIEDELKAKMPEFSEYHLLVDTGRWPDAGTDGEVFIQLLGSRGKTGLISLKKGFKASSRLEFSIFAKEVGKVDNIRLVADTPDRWYADQVFLQAPEGMREFPVGQYIGWPNNPEVTVQPALGDLGPSGAFLAVALSKFVEVPGHPARIEIDKANQLEHRRRRAQKFL